jgi:phosphonate transport system substrate-binding protein
VLAEQHLGPAASFFSEVQSVERSTQCVLALYFGRVRACVIDDQLFETAREMNPQLNRLSVLMRSAAFVEGVMAVPVGMASKLRELTVSILGETRLPGGSQILTIFHSGPPVPATARTFAPLRELFRKYRRLVGDPLLVGARSPRAVN